ncbi:MAG: SGNH/GDSL hydrolase family protein [Microbacteriaceae bacterium]
MPKPAIRRVANLAAAIGLAMAMAMALCSCSFGASIPAVSSVGSAAQANAVPGGAHAGPHPPQQGEADVAAPLAVATMGDSITFGRGVRPTEAWPALVAGHNGWTLTNVGCSGAGFVTVGWSGCGGTYAGEVPRVIAARPEVIVIQASRNDIGQPDDRIRVNAAALVTQLRSALPQVRFVGISAIWNDTARPPQLAGIDDGLKQAVLAEGGTFLTVKDALIGHRDLLQPDDVHPTAAGQAVLADVIATVLTAARIGR